MKPLPTRAIEPEHWIAKQMKLEERKVRDMGKFFDWLEGKR